MSTRLIRSILLVATCMQGFSLSAQVWPYSPNDWSNPEFVNRFVGSYGVETAREPKISTAEGEIFQNVAALAETDLAGAARLLAQSVTAESSAAIDYTLANIYLQLGRTEQAKTAYRAAIKKFPNFMRAYKNLGLGLIQDGEFEEAQKVLVKSIELGDGTGNTYGLLAFCYLNLGNLDSALDAYRIASVLMPDNKDWKVGKAHCLLQTGRYEEAQAIFGELIQNEPDNAQYFISRSNAFLYLGQFEQAALHLEIVRRFGGAKGSTLAQLGNLYLNMEMGQLAGEVFIEALSAPEPVSVERAFSIANNLLARWNYSEGLAFIEALKARETSISQKDRIQLLNIEAELQLAIGNNDQAAGILESVVKADPTNGRAFLLLGNYNWTNGQVEEAAYFFEMAQTIDETRFEALVDHARMRVSLRDYSGAASLLKDALAIERRESIQNYLEAVERVLDQIQG